MGAVGFSTGAVAFEDFERAIHLLHSTTATAIELSALRQHELVPLLSALPEVIHVLRKRYGYISFHAPTKFADEARLVDTLAPVAELELNIVVHPDCIRDHTLWRRLGNRVCLENMDSRKPTGRTAAELGRFYDLLPDAGLCFDIAHARQIDPTMTEGLKIIEIFGDRLAQVHISELNSKGRHFPVSFLAKRAYEPFVGLLAAVPVIIESVVTLEQIQPELDTIRHLLSSTISQTSLVKCEVTSTTVVDFDEGGRYAILSH